ncbi:MAG TPA: SDR family NAD(P)-dependent oxidoreductase [Myxococcota bacterium]|nr:SDR family NAD(P)-dependent oxidoreductase [Myxococcota bacterium]
MNAASTNRVLVTGASSGIGAAAADLLARTGFRVAGTSRDPERAALRSPHIEWVAVDVRDDASVSEGVKRAIDRMGGLEALVCNAGIGIFGSVEEVPLHAAREQFETNFFGTLRTLRAALPELRRSRSARIAIVGSLAGRAPIPFQAHYSASKAALDALALALHNELFGTGVRVSLIEPGDIHTAFNDATDFELIRDSSYGERAARCREVVERSLENAPGPELVARVIVRALTTLNPRVRYAVGPDARLVSFARRWLPERLGLFLIRRHFRV